MHLGNILGFALLGLGMICFPTLAPGLFPPDAGVAANLSGLWLRFMGSVNVVVGGVLWVHYQLIPRLVQLLAWRPVIAEELRPGEILRPALELCEELEGREPDGGQSAA